MPFDPERFARARLGGHTGRLGLAYHAHGADWVEMALPWSPDLLGDTARQLPASGPVIALMDVAASLAVWIRRDAFVPHATLDLRVDHLRPARAGQALMGRGECYRIAPSLAFVRGQAHDGDPADPIAHVTGTYMVIAA
jgi:uncharacterized protein (TIGR00369 family)